MENIHINLRLRGSDMQNKTFFQKLKCATKGLIAGIKSESSFTYYFCILIATLVINFVLNFPALYFLVNLICAFGVFSAECLNTAIEKICDFLTTEYNEKIKFIKDIAAGGVLCWGVVYFLSEIILIGVVLFG